MDTKHRPFPVQGVHIDCRAQMLRFDRLQKILSDLARWGYNAVLLEYEDHFPYTGRLKDIASSDALTHRQIRDLNRQAADLGLQIIPLVQCLGHLTYVLRLPAFRRLSEGYPKTAPYTVCPGHPGSRQLFQDMVEQVMAMHPDCRYFHLGGDEAKLEPDCPHCHKAHPGASAAERLMEHYLDRAQWVRSLGPDPILWGDLFLAHPEQRERLRGHAIIMDWDYWSATRPADEPQHLWGMYGKNLPGVDTKNPETWPGWYRKLYKDSVLLANGKARPFPFAKFLHDEGFPFMMASSARCGGDTFCAPTATRHVDNVMGSIRAAREHRALGVIVTSWALRRPPWPLTEPALIAGGLALKKPNVGLSAVDQAFVREHFGSDDKRLARIPRLLGVPAPPILHARPRTIDLESNRWVAQAFAQRLESTRTNLSLSLRQLATLRKNCREADRLLKAATPGTARQRECVALWQWAIRVMGFYAEHGPSWLKGEKPASSLKAMKSLIPLTKRVLGKIYTPETVADEIQTRFGSLADYLKE
jgi:hypothetical protein